jgi:hypothetical protein
MRRLLLIAMCCVARTASADPCTAEQPEAGVPVRIATGPADFGMLPEACAATAVSLSGRMGILIAEEDFYGSLLVAGALRARIELPGGSWLSTSLPGPEYRFVANATLEADSVDLSASTLGYHVPIVVGRLQLAPYFRFMLPSETVFQHARRLGLEHGVSMVAPAGKYLEMIAGYGLPLYLTVQPGGTEAAYLPTVSFDVAARPVRWFVGALGISVRVFPEEEESFESLDPRAALRFYPTHGLLIEATGAVPVLGRDRTDGLVSLAIGWIAEAGVLSPAAATP